MGPKDRANNLWMAEGSAASTALDRCYLLPIEGLFTHCKHDKVSKQQPVQTEVATEVPGVDAGVDDEDAGVEARRRDGGPAPLQQEDPGVEPPCHLEGLAEVRVRRGPRQPTARSPGPHRGGAVGQGVLDVVACGMARRVEEGQQDRGVQMRSGVDDL